MTMEPALEQALGEASGLLFLCTGNMVRSAFAELYARQRGCPLPLASAATVYRNGRLMAETAQALAARGVAPAALKAFRPRHLDDLGLTFGAELGPRVLVLAMARMHLDALAERPALLERAFLLGAALGRPPEIADPVLDGADFAQTFERVAECVEAVCARLARQGAG